MTTYAQMLELSDPPDAYVRGHGWGSVRVLMAGSLNANPSCWVRLYGSGKVLWVDQSDLRLAANPGDPRDGIEIPEDRKPQAKFYDNHSPWMCMRCGVQHFGTQTPDGSPRRCGCTVREILVPDLPDPINPS